MNTEKQFVYPAAVLAAGVVFAAIIAAYAFYAVHTLDNTLSVTGSATQSATSDSAKWTVSVSHAAYEGAVAQMQSTVASESAQVNAFFAKAGIDASKITSSPVMVDQEYSSDSNAPRKYNIHEDISIQSDNPQLVLKLSKEIASLASRGIVVQAQSPQYLISNLPKLRVALIGKAITDAKSRAIEIASSTGRAVGPLQSASGGVVQVLAPDSVDVADYGSYDTSTIEKTVMVTARATFYIR